ncbi:MAG: Gfo/Idh/MocA family oxidoreductase [Chloroflexota bacterium]|nr:MAG: Gfo/Idh/MocA family oxidoreductase [Chloroflexota bacterium]
MPKLLRAAVIGAGNMGRNHARVYSEMDDVELVAVADPVPEMLSRIAMRHRVRTYSDYRVMLEREPIDLVSVVVPTELHFTVAREVLQARIPVLIEKPIAATVEEGAALISLANELQVPFTVGHIERFNPAIICLKNQLSSGALGKVYQVHVRRIGPFPQQIKDVGVVIDLATHDLDIMHYLTDANVTRLHAEIGRRLHTAHEDLLSAVLRFDNDVIGVLDVNWLTPTKVREISVIGARGMFVGNYLTQDLVFFENDAAPPDGNWQELVISGVTEGRAIHFKINKKEPLREELEAFLCAVRTGSAPPMRAEDALLALAVAHQMVQAAGSGETLLLDESHGFAWPPFNLRAAPLLPHALAAE